MLTRFYPDIAVFRQKNWQDWLEGGAVSKQYQQLHLPDIAVYFWELWDAPIERGANPRDLTPTILDLVKGEIIDLMVRMYIIPTTMLGQLSVRRSSRGMRHVDDDMVIKPSRKRARLTTPSSVSSVEDEDDFA